MVELVDEDECITTRHNMTTATFLTEDGLYKCTFGYGCNLPR